MTWWLALAGLLAAGAVSYPIAAWLDRRRATAFALETTPPCSGHGWDCFLHDYGHPLPDQTPEDQ